MDIHYDLVIAGIVNFLVLVLLFRKFLWDKIVQQIEKRTQLLNKLKKADDEYKKMIEFVRSQTIFSKKLKKEKKKSFMKRISSLNSKRQKFWLMLKVRLKSLSMMPKKLLQDLKKSSKMHE